MKKLILFAFAAACLWTASVSVPSLEVAPDSQRYVVLEVRGGETGV